MKLYFSPGSCSLAPHIAAREAGLDVEALKVEFGPEGRTAAGRNYYDINPLGVVPTLELDDGDILTENAVILQYLAAQAPDLPLGPPADDRPRWHFLSRLHFVATELHKGFSPLFKPYVEGETRTKFVEALNARFDLVEAILASQPWLTGEAFTIVDIYAFVVLRWSDRHKLDLSAWPRIVDFKTRAAARPAVQQAMREQGLV